VNLVRFGLLPLVERKAKEFLKLCKDNGLEVRITEGYRTLARQQELYNQGRTTPGAIVTNAKAGESLHNWKCAFDVVFVNGGYNRPNKDWQAIGKIGKSIGLEWGGDWVSFQDRPHFQLTLGYSLQDFQKNTVNYNNFI